MISIRSLGRLLGRRRSRHLLVSALLAACLGLPQTGCSMLPPGIGNIPTKIGLKSKQAELRDKVQADKFPTAKEAGL
jgi:hypothetical protein